LLAIFHALSVEGAANDFVTNARKILNATATNKNDGVLLKIVAFTWDVSSYFHSRCETNTCNFAKR
jgi:hypothetical protein